MRSRNGIALIAILALAQVACRESFDPSLPPAADAARLQQIVDSTLVSLGAPGAVVGIEAAGGERFMIASGNADLSTASAMNVANRFRVGSITKTMVATIVLQLVDEGRLELDDTIARWLPGVVPNADIITVRQLLNHTSGIPDYLDDAVLEARVLADPGRQFSIEELIAAANRQTAPFVPGAPNRWEYSNTNYVLLGVVIERVTGKSLGSELQQRIFDRVNMPSSLFPTAVAIPAPFSRGYIDRFGASNFDITTIVSPSLAAGAGAVVSNAADLMLWANALARGQLISSAMHLEQITPVLASGGEGYGLGVQAFGGWIGHSGEIAGYEASMYSRPGVGTIVVLVNKSPATESVSYEIFNNIRWAEFGIR